MLFRKTVRQLMESAHIKSVIAGDEREVVAMTEKHEEPVQTPFARAQLYAMQVAEGAQHQGWVEFSAAPSAVDTIVEDCHKLGLFLADVNASGPRVQMFWIHGKDDSRWHFAHQLGRRFKAGSNAGKSGLKRQRVLKLAGLSPGSAGSTASSGNASMTVEDGYTIHTIETPEGSLRICEVPCPHDANDNDGLVTERGYRVLQELCKLDNIDEASTVQSLIVGPTGAIKFAGQVLCKEATGDTAEMISKAPHADIYVGSPGVDRKVEYDRKVALRVNVWHEDDQSGLVPADGLQQALAVLGRFTPQTVSHYTNRVINRNVRGAQLSGFREKDNNPVQKPDETPMAHAAALLVAQLHRLFEARAARDTSQAAWEANGSSFAHPNTRSAEAQLAYRLRGLVSKNRRRRDGLPGMILPGHWVKLMSSMFVGDSLYPVKQPRRGWARLVWRRPDQPFGLVINNADFSTIVWIYGLDGSDFDDKVTVTLCVDEDGNPWILVLRRPSSPYGGMMLRITRAQAAEYEQNTGIPAMPLREGWQEFDSFCRTYAEMPNAIDLGPELEPVPCTNDMADQIAAAKRQASQVGWTGKVSYLVAALFLSGHSMDGQTKFVTSDLIDNAVEGGHDGEYVYDLFLNRAATMANEGKPFFRPSVEVIEGSILERQAEIFKRSTTIRYAPNDEFKKVWDEAVKQEAWTWDQHQTMEDRKNGPYHWMMRELPEPTLRQAHHAVNTARNLWSSWGVSKRSMPYGKEGEEAMAALTATIVAEIHKTVQDAYAAAREELNYEPGTFAAAIKQVQACEPKYWQKFDRKGAPKRYHLIDALPREELIAFFDRGELPPADPTWFARTWPIKGCDSLQPWDEVEIRVQEGRYHAYRDGEPVAILGPEARVIANLDNEFLGFVPGQDPKAPPVATYRNSARQLEQLTQERYVKAEDTLNSLRVFAKKSQP